MTQLGDLTLARYVPRVALDWVADRPDELWRRVDGTMVFADISGFTALSERLATKGRIGAEELVETLSRVFGAMLDTAADRGGQLLKFGGDALLFLFDGDDHARQAASTAVEMRAELRRAADIVTSVGRLALSVSIGVHTGSFDLFLVGSSHRELVVLGPGTSAVVAAENAANAGEIVLSPGAVAALDARDVRHRDDGVPMLRWRKAPVEPSGRLPARADDHEGARRLLPTILADAFETAVADPAHRVATISFMKFSGTDAILERDGPAALAERLHETVSIAQAAFVAEDVALLCVDCDEDGGKIFASTGVPLTSEDDEGRMLRAARAILAAEPPLPLQIGINRGHVFAAEVGTPRRSTFSAMGDTTNTAARICGKSEQGYVFVHPAVLEHARTLYESEPVGPFVFKGKALPQMLYRLGEEIGQRRDDAAGEVALIGRDDELRRLRAALDPTAPPGVAMVAGPVGIGKTRLVHEALAVETKRSVLRLHAEPYGATKAYRVFRDPLRATLGVERGTQARMRAQLERAVRARVPEHEAMLALIGDVLDVEVDPSSDVTSLLPEFRPDRTADIVIELLAAEFPDGIVLVVEDAHWADGPSAHLIGRIAGAAPPRGWSVVVVRRNEPGGVELADVATIALGPLPAEATRELVVGATESAPLRPHEVDLVVERAGGNPLFVGELVRAAQELGSLDAVPTSLQGAMAAQVDALDPLARRVLSYGSVLGRSFRRSVLIEVLRAEDIRVDQATVDRLERFLEPDGSTRWRFRNGLLRDIVYDGLGFNLRSRLHLEAGGAVERLSDDLAAEADTLALHFAAGGEHTKAYRYAVTAAERSERSYATATAALQLERAIESARRVADVGDDELRDLWVRLGTARDLAGLLDAAVAAFGQAIRLADDPASAGELLLRRAVVRERAGSFSVALRDATTAARRVDGLTGEVADSIRARARAFAATVRQRQERASDALRLATQAAEAAEACGDLAAAARAYGVLSWAGLVLGRGDPVEDGRRALAYFEELDDAVGQARIANNLGGLAYFAGQWDSTLELYRDCVEACRRVGNITDVHLASANIGEVLVNQGRLDEAEPMLREAARVLQASGHQWGAVFAEMHLGRLLTARGELDAAETVLRGCVEANRRMGSSEWVFEAAIHLADCLVAQARPADALAVIDDAASRTNDDVSILEAVAALVTAKALATLGRDDDAVEALLGGVEAARDRVLEFDLGRLLLLAEELGVTDSRLGTDEPGEEARSLLTRLGVRSHELLV